VRVIECRGVRVEVYGSPEAACRVLAAEWARRIRDGVVLGLATGSSPLPLYREWIRMHRHEGLAFDRVEAFNLDEYRGLAADDSRRYRAFMARELFDPVGVPTVRRHLPDADVPEAEIDAECRRFEGAIAAAGGIELQLLGIGRNGHIGFNEPGAASDSRTRRVRLDAATREDAAADFGGIERVPEEALTMGIGTILEAREIVLLAWGGGKAEAVARALGGEPSPEVPASFLQHHPRVRFLLDGAAASGMLGA